MGVAPARRELAADEIVAAGVDQRGHFGFEQRSIELLADADFFPGIKRGGDRLAEHQTRDQIDDRDADFDRLALGVPVMLIKPPQAWTIKS